MGSNPTVSARKDFARRSCPPRSAWLKKDGSILNLKDCDDSFESNFFCYFALNFNRIGLKQLITTSYKSSPVVNTQLRLFDDDKTLTKSKGRLKINANKFIVSKVKNIDGDGEFNLKDIAKQLKANKNNEWTLIKKIVIFNKTTIITYA